MFRYFRRHHLLSFLTVLFLLTKVLTVTGLNLLRGTLIDQITSEGLSGLSSLLPPFALLVGLQIIGGLGLAFSRFQLKTEILTDLKSDFFQSLLSRPRTFLASLDSANLLSAYTEKMATIDQKFLTVGGNLLEYAANILLTMGAIFWIDWRVGLCAFCLFVLPVFLTRSQNQALSQAQKDALTENENHTALFLQNIEGMEAIKNYGIETPIQTRYRKSLAQLTESNYRQSLVQARTNAISSASSYFSLSAIAAVSILLVAIGSLSVGEFIAIFSLSSAVNGQIYWLARSFESVLSSRPAREEVLRFLEEGQERKPSAIPAATQPQEEAGADSSLVLSAHHLSFAYPNSPLLFDQIHFDIYRGEKILLTGSTGTGKSTLFDLILGFLQPSSGTLDQTTEVRLIDQSPFLFAGSIEDNLFASDPAQVSPLLEQIGLAHLWKENKQIADRGNNLSGGERKRIGLCRGLLQEADLLLVDEPFANLDPQRVQAVEDLLLGLEDRAVLIISHEYSPRLLKAVDRIYQLEGQKLIERTPA